MIINKLEAGNKRFLDMKMRHFISVSCAKIRVSAGQMKLGLPELCFHAKNAMESYWYAFGRVHVKYIYGSNVVIKKRTIINRNLIRSTDGNLEPFAEICRMKDSVPQNSDLFHFHSLPDRDEVLQVIYDFLRAMGKHDTVLASRLVMIKDMPYFVKVLHDSLIQYLDLVIEDDQWEDYEGRNMAFEVDDPAHLDEDLTQPQFSGKKFMLEPNETVSVQIGLKGRVTPIRLHFTLLEADALYYLKLQRITADK
jgi:hypothetical protein